MSSIVTGSCSVTASILRRGWRASPPPAASACRGPSTTNKLSVKLEDIGRQQVKNLPDPVHAYMIAPHSGVADTKGKPRKDGATFTRTRLLTGSLIAVALIGAAAAALQLYRPGPAFHAAEAPSLSPSPASL